MKAYNPTNIHIKTETTKNNFDISSTKKEIDSLLLISVNVTTESIVKMHTNVSIDVMNKMENKSIHFIFRFLKWKNSVKTP